MTNATVTEGSPAPRFAALHRRNDLRKAAIARRAQEQAERWITEAEHHQGMRLIIGFAKLGGFTGQYDLRHGFNVEAEWKRMQNWLRTRMTPQQDATRRYLVHDLSEDAILVEAARAGRSAASSEVPKAPCQDVSCMGLIGLDRVPANRILTAWLAAKGARLQELSDESLRNQGRGDLLAATTRLQ